MSFSSKLTDKDKAIINSIFNPYLPLGEILYDEEIPSNEDDATFNDENLKQLEIEAIKCAENKDYEKSLHLLEQVINLCPQRPATYNNRAQVYRLMGNIEAAFLDISESIKLCTKKGKTYCQSLCQKGILYRKLGKNEEARKAFQEAAELGSAFAKQQIVEMNPYAALCNQMLSQVMNTLN